MSDKQEFIYFICGEDRKILMHSNFIQKLKARNIEVLLLDDPIDEYTMQNLAEYEKKKTKNVAKGDLKLDSEEDVKAKKKALKKMYKPLIDWWKNILDKKVKYNNNFKIG
jgi:HSP90 family molecular chaperone